MLVRKVLFLLVAWDPRNFSCCLSTTTCIYALKARINIGFWLFIPPKGFPNFFAIIFYHFHIVRKIYFGFCIARKRLMFRLLVSLIPFPYLRSLDLQFSWLFAFQPINIPSLYHLDFFRFVECCNYWYILPVIKYL